MPAGKDNKVIINDVGSRPWLKGMYSISKHVLLCGGCQFVIHGVLAPPCDQVILYCVRVSVCACAYECSALHSRMGPQLKVAHYGGAKFVLFY